jgi:hypothetical protein
MRILTKLIAQQRAAGALIWLIVALATTYFGLVLMGRLARPVWIPNDRESDASVATGVAVAGITAAAFLSFALDRKIAVVRVWVAAILTGAIATAVVVWI